MDTMDTASIADIITEHGDYIGAEYRFLPPDEFTESFGDFPTARYGWTFPEIGFFCPEMIAAQTATMSTSEVSDYLTAILWMCDRHIYEAYHQPHMSVGDRHRMIESELYQKGPDSLRLMSAVELAALDA